MIFITGGAYQGKTAYAKEHFPEAGGFRIVERYQELVRQQMQEGLNPMEEAQRLLVETEPETRLVILCDEVGCGLVPTDAFERDYREQVGRVGGFFAGRAEQVIRVVCGIGGRIK